MISPDLRFKKRTFWHYEESSLPRGRKRAECHTLRRTRPAPHAERGKQTCSSHFKGRSLFLDLGLTRKYKWPAIIADVSKPILGADFLRQSDLLVDLTRERLINAQTFHSTADPTDPSAICCSKRGSFFTRHTVMKLCGNDTNCCSSINEVASVCDSISGVKKV